jgi:cobalt/nickel transport system permease protein
MKHDFVDRYARLKSPVHSLDARAKAIALFALIIACVTTPATAWWPVCIYAGILAIITVAAHIPWRYVLTRVLIVLPFIVVVAVFVPFMRGGGMVHIGALTLPKHGLLVLWNVVSKSIISVWAIILLSNTTVFSDLMHGLERLHVPKFFTIVSAFMYRYVFIIIDEAERMKRARDSRGFSGRWLWHAKVVGHIIASLFLRSQERAERVYQAMSARGFDGTFPRWRESHFMVRDYFFMSIVVLTALAGRLVAIWT